MQILISSMCARYQWLFVRQYSIHGLCYSSLRHTLCCSTLWDAWLNLSRLELACQAQASGSCIPPTSRILIQLLWQLPNKDANRKVRKLLCKLLNCNYVKIVNLAAHKVDVPSSVTYLNQTPIFEWYVVGVAPRIDIKKMCLKEIGLHTQNMIIVWD